MTTLITSLRLIIAEKLLHMAMLVAPKNLSEGRDLVTAVHNYCVSQIAKSASNKVNGG